LQCRHTSVQPRPSHMSKRCYRGTVFNADTPQIRQSPFMSIKVAIEALFAMQTHLSSTKALSYV
jgi:hypothetical protein